MLNLPATTQSPVDSALAALEFTHNPFTYLEASSDPYLSRYLVAGQSGEFVRNPQSQLIFAPAGGGKTAMRIGSFRDCWVPVGTKHPFPIPLICSRPVTEDIYRQQFERIGRVAARTLLIALLYQPDLLALRSNAERRAVIGFIRSGLNPPWSLDRCLQMLAAGESVTAIAYILDASCLLPPIDQPNSATLIELLNQQHERLIPPDQLFDHALHILLDSMGFPYVLLQIDGVDADSLTADNPLDMLATFDWLVQHAASLALRQVFLKAFLPQELIPATTWELPVIEVKWTAEQMIEVLRQRVRVATNGRYDSFAPFAERNLRNIDNLLVQIAHPLPRELILVAQHLLRYYASQSEVAGKISQEHLDLVEDWYNNQVWIPPPSTFDGTSHSSF